MMKAVCLFAVVAAAFGHGLEVTRTVKEIMAGGSAQVFASPGCKKTDQYGSNDCEFAWGQKLTAHVNATLPEAVDAGAKLDVDLKVDGMIPFKFTCPACGGQCSFEVPIVKKKVEFALPACPLLPAGPYSNVTTVELPAKDPSPVSVSFKGTVTVKDAAGKTIVEVEVQGKL